ncbi:MAG TPA: CoB--CoM heterodisulfide reductase iron-sulfur subunit A family protein, partial [Methanomicrobiales archaeon]|nr:CoB--CoM heterodisulfide reductase iron-sulfur subunit A family protein [Methanomicrobiales archaeon]
LAPKMIDCFNHERITVYTCSEVTSVEGSVGHFHVKVLRKPRYVDEEKCTGCGECIPVCPFESLDEFNVGLGTRRSMRLYFQQAVPRVSIIDEDTCTKCGNCRSVCEVGAIDLKQEPEEIDVEVGAIIVATGLDMFDPSGITEYGYGRYKDVITSLQYERLINAAGPTHGHLERISDGRPVNRLAFIQCVGSRDVKNNPYCSSVCCMFSTKSAMLAREHQADIENYIFYTELRGFGKRFQEYIDRGRDEYGIHYIRAKPGEIRQNEKKNLVIWYYDHENACVTSLEVDLVVLAVALLPSHGSQDLARILGTELDDYGFFKIRDPLYAPADTTVPGIFVCGYGKRPMDITDAVIDASGASARAAEVIAAEKRDRTPLEEREP